MSVSVRRSSLRRAGLVSVLLVAANLAVAAQAPAASSAAPAKELLALLQSKKMEAFAVKDASEAGRFVAILLVPGVQMMVVSAGYERPTDIEYRLYTKDYLNAYMDLNSSIMSKDKVFFEDRGCDGLSVKPVNGGDDAVTTGTTKRVFDGDFADPKKKPDPKKISQADYLKAYEEADARYAKLLNMLLEDLKKMGEFGDAAHLR
jgi:hypothetical protein